MSTKFTKTAIAALKAPETGYALHWDDTLPGFGLRITASNVRSFILQRRIKGRDRRITIGRYPGVSPEIARKEAQKLLGQIAGGGDPVAERARHKLEGTALETVFTEYTRHRRRRKDHKPLKERTKADMLRALDKSFADWKQKPITGITSDMVKRRYRELAERSPARANIAMRYLRAVLNFATATYRDSEDKPILTYNPVRVLSEASLWHGIGSRRTVLSPDDLKVWLPAVLALAETPPREPGEGKLKPRLRNGELFRDFFLFLALTGCRKSEATELLKVNVDMKRGIVRFPDTKNRTDHELPITGYLRKLLQRRMDASDSDLVFASPHDGRGVSNLRYTIDRITESTKLKFSPHDLRRLCATSLERLAVPSYTVKAILNHLPGASDVTGHYTVVDMDMRRAAMEKLEQFILAHAQKGNKVVPLRSKRSK